MYSFPPAAISILFLSYGFYALASRGISRISASFFLVCITTFFWQSTWAVLFQIQDPIIALYLVKFGYFFILFLPSSVYHFLSEICGRHEERRYIYLSYAVAAILAVFLLSSDLFVSGFYRYYWGYYPKAGVLHPIHLLQTFFVVNRGLFITYVAQKNATDNLQTRLRLCLVGLLIFLFAAIDYLCNYGFEFYPPGLVFTAIALGFLTIAIVKYDLLNPMALAGAIAHEMRTPLAIIRMQATGITQYFPTLLEGYRLAVENKLIKASIRNRHLSILTELSERIANEVDKSNAMIDMMLASTSMERPDSISFERYSIEACIVEALERYPFAEGDREKVDVAVADNFEFHGSDTLLIFVLFNLLKNAIYALKLSGKGEILISAKTANGRNILSITDTGPGIPKKVLPHIFDSFYSTKRKGGGAGIGLSFCKKVMAAFKGSIKCNSREGEYTTFILEFPPV
ncbi:MAG: ATP-binding protein [Sulfuricellaceae bacterium]